MGRRIGFLVLFFVTVVCIFMGQKPFFMFYNDAVGRGIVLADYFRVMKHGLSLDAATAGYLSSVPLLVLLVSVWFKRFPLRVVLTGYYVLVGLLVAVIFVSDMALYPFWNFKLDASIFLYMDSPKNALASVSTGFILVRFVVVLLLAGVIVWLLRAVTPKLLSGVRRKLIGTLELLLLGGILFIVIRGGFTESTTNIGQAYFCENEFLNHSAVNPAFSLISSVSKTRSYEKECDFFPEQERARLFDGLYPPFSGRNHVGLLKTTRPDVLIILLEGFGATMVESLGGVPDVSPNIDRLSKEGIFFTNCYANSFRTDRGVICALSGYPSFPDVSVMKMPSKSRTLPSIARKLWENGYSTEFLYGGDINFTNMKSYLLGSGYQQVTADTDFPLDKRKNAWGVNDDVTFDYLYEKLCSFDKSPWHVGFLTLSSHEPFEVPYARLQEKKTNAFAFTDECFGHFVDRIKELPMWNNLLIVCLPDHGYFYPEEGNSHAPRIHHIPMLWLGGAIKEPMVIDKLMNQSDLAATLLGQMGIDCRDFSFSRNVLGEEYTYPFAYYTFNNGFAFCDSTGVTLVDNNSGQVQIDEPLPSESRLNKGKAVLQTSYDDLGSR